MRRAAEIRLRLSIIQKELSNKNITEEQKKALNKQANKLVALENIECKREEIEENIDWYREIIQKMIKEGYSEIEVWEYCKLEIESIEQELTKIEAGKRKANSINPTSVERRKQLDSAIRSLKQHEDILRGIKKGLKHCQIIYCKNYQPKAKPKSSKTEKKKTDTENDGSKENYDYNSLIERLADEITGKRSSRYEAKTITACLKYFLNHPKQSRANIIKSVKSEISESDNDRLSGQVLSGWEKNLIKRIELINPEFAHKLKRE